MSAPTVRLSEYLLAIQSVIKLGFGEGTWVKAEITAMSSKAGHYYFELAEKDQSTDKTIATCRATLWKGQAQRLISQFRAESGIDLSRDLSVLVKVKASFHPQYGFSLNIEDIDSSYTLGDLAQKYQDIVQRLIDEQLIDLNRTLPTPFDIQQVLVIAPENAAGLGDFQKDAQKLAESQVCQFSYAHATFQGISASLSIRQALHDALRDWLDKHDTTPDLIVVIRGGGAVNDLAYLNDYELAAMLSTCSVPIWVGIGHERDRTILDEIAHRSFDTPSKVIAGIRNHISSVADQAQEYFEAIYATANYELNAFKAELNSLLALSQSNSKYQLTQLGHRLNQLLQQHQFLAQQSIQQAGQQAEQLMREMLLQSPRHTLERGYAIVRLNGKPVRSIHALEGQTVQIDMQNGSALATVQQITHKPAKQ
ncbi:exodeoxyribonuclease VII large subunit [Alkanindiges sp. WGS2144]|uniref:exodeoxyribonuclease VII large subunit n=1 Tax=Alkanindiges sp. WGS2144 TaxID=3366808 RepID=UPI0037524B7A